MEYHKISNLTEVKTYLNNRLFNHLKYEVLKDMKDLANLDIRLNLWQEPDLAENLTDCLQSVRLQVRICFANFPEFKPQFLAKMGISNDQDLYLSLSEMQKRNDSLEIDYETTIGEEMNVPYSMETQIPNSSIHTIMQDIHDEFSGILESLNLNIRDGINLRRRQAYCEYIRAHPKNILLKRDF
ncbi:MAG TPA: hypothetical protein PLQ36_00415 [Candidatus Gracilibacteria bacterium]|nr:hypothetical protein [Candidatus Gracilibacteria bacterium]